MLRFEIDSTAGPLRMPWKRGVAVGRGYELLREDVLEHLRLAQREIGFEYCRFHAVFHDDMAVVRREKDGSLRYQWHHVDKIYDALLAMGLRPFVELNPMPAALASGEQTMFHYQMNVTPPKLYQEWQELVAAFTAHCVARYGLEEVQRWRFEVWNEPNLSAFWSGTQAEYFELYAASARGVKSVHPSLKVGGPASSKASWLTDFIDYCSRQAVPVDFVSTHLYPQDEYVDFPEPGQSPHAPGSYFSTIVRRAQAEVESSVYPELEVHWTEWNAMSSDSGANTSWIDNPTNDNLFAASLIVHNCLALDDAADSFCFWVASDIFEEAGIPMSPFSCTYGLVTIDGIPKASFNAMRLLSNLRGERMQVKELSALAPGQSVVATRELFTTHVLACNHKPLETAEQPALTRTIDIPAHGPGPHTVVLERLRAGAGSAWETWVRLGRPQHLSRAQERLIRRHAEPETTFLRVAPENGRLHVDLKLEANEVLYAEIIEGDLPSVGKGSLGPSNALWDKAMGEKSR